MKSHTSQGGCHVPDYRTEVLILIPDIDRTDGIAMRKKATGATKDPPTGFAALPKSRTGRRRPPLFVEDHRAAEGFPLIREHMSHLPKRPLMELLVDFLAVV